MAELLTRQQLHDLIWSAPMRDVAKQLGISDVGLRKQCVKAVVPPPPQGHWNRVKAGQAVKVASLPPRPPGISDEVSVGKHEYRNYHENLLANEPVPPVFDETMESVRERVAKNIGTVLASKNLSTPHIAFRQQVEEDQRKKLSGSHWERPALDTPFERRRLRILQGLFYGLGRVDCTATVQDKEVRIIFIAVGHQQVQVSLGRPVIHQRSRSVEQTGDQLKFTILKGHYDQTERVSWVDKEDDLVEAHLSEIATEIVVAGELQYREHLQWRYDARIKHREELRQAEIRKKLEREKAEQERLRKLEADRLQRLAESAENHRKANDIRGFVASVVAMPHEDAKSALVQKWREWALGQADRIDPITTGRIWDTVNDTQ